jgi:signal transduction histidine kinase
MTAEEGTTAHRNLKMIERETERCKKIIENLLKFARQDKTELEPTDVNQVIRDAAAIVEHQMTMNEVTLTVKVQEALPPVQGNANQLQQVLMNLIINAQQAMEGRPGEIIIAGEDAGAEAVEISVSDNGPGMPEEVRRKIFEPFFTTKPTGQGTGLGLSVSYGIIQDHQGKISVESAPGAGTRFTLRLPALQGVRVETPVFA